MNVLLIDAQLNSKGLGQSAPARDVTQMRPGRLLWAMLLAIFCSEVLADTPCINSTYPQTVTAETIEGQTRLILGKPTSAGIANIGFTIVGNLVTLNYTCDATGV